MNYLQKERGTPSQSICLQKWSPKWWYISRAAPWVSIVRNRGQWMTTKCTVISSSHANQLPLPRFWSTAGLESTHVKSTITSTLLFMTKWPKFWLNQIPLCHTNVSIHLVIVENFTSKLSIVHTNYCTKVPRNSTNTCMDILHHACIRLSPRTSRCEDDCVCSMASYEQASVTCHLEPLLCRPPRQAMCRQCLQSVNTFNKVNRHVHLNKNWIHYSYYFQLLCPQKSFLQNVKLEEKLGADWSKVVATIFKSKKRKRIAVSRIPSHSYETPLAIWDHSVTCHPTQVNAPRLHPSQ